MYTQWNDWYDWYPKDLYLGTAIYVNMIDYVGYRNLSRACTSASVCASVSMFCVCKVQDVISEIVSSAFNNKPTI